MKGLAYRILFSLFVSGGFFAMTVVRALADGGSG
jgi:hypothetical protein